MSGPELNTDTNSESTCKTKRSRTTPKGSKVDSAEPQKAFLKKKKHKWERVEVPSLPEIRTEKEK